LPILYRQVQVRWADERAIISPEQGRWDISPLVFNLLEQRAAAPSEPLDDLIPQIIEKSHEISSESGEDLTATLIERLAQAIPELGEELHKEFPTDSVDPMPSPWILFAPPTSTSAVIRNLMYDYERLEKEIEATPSDTGGLALLEDLAPPAAGPPPDVLPIVALDESQHKAVSGILAGKPVSVVSGPPGCGKSQVVVSLLLNAWAQGTSVLFASNNNKAVDVVRERLERFESEFPIAIRAGSRKASNLEDALRRTLNMVAVDNGSRSKAVESPASQRDELLKRKSQLTSFLQTNLPRRVNDALNSAIRAYASYTEACSELQRLEEGLKRDLSELGYDLEPDAFTATVVRPFAKWLDSRDAVRDSIARDADQRRALESDAENGQSQRNQAAQRVGLDPRSVKSWEWLKTAPGPEVFEAWLTRYTGTLSEPIERKLEVVAWETGFDEWKSSKSAREWAAGARKASKDILGACSALEPTIQELSRLLAARDEATRRLEEEGISPDTSADRATLESWSGTYAHLCALAPKTFDWLPWSERKKLLRELSRLESTLRQGMPLGVWRKLGQLNEAGREALSQVVEVTLNWVQKRDAWAGARPELDKVEMAFSGLREHAGQLHVSPLPADHDLPAWRQLAQGLEQKASLADHAAAAWEQREAREAATKRLRDLVSEYQSTASGVPIREAWVSAGGSAFHGTVMSLASDPGPDEVVAARRVSYTDSCSSLLDAWRTARDGESKRQKALQDVSNVPSSVDRVAAWWNQRPDAVVIDAETGTDLPSDTGPIADHHRQCNKWAERWELLVEKQRPEELGRIQKEWQWAVEKLQEARDEVPPNSRSQVARVVDPILEQAPGPWPVDKLQPAFENFSPEKLSAQIDHIDGQLEHLSFDLAKHAWLEDMGADASIHEALENLNRHYKRHKERIAPDGYEDFAKALRAVPIWITTALSPQSIPLSAGVFDLLVIDEATQCTLTNLLPLIYRAKRIAVIGDPEQLPAIPSLGHDAQESIARKYGVVEWMDLLGHADNDVYRTAVNCLPRRQVDVLSLLEHYRSHPLIIGFANQHVYQRRLQLRKDPSLAKTVSFGQGVHAHPVRGTCERGNRGRSWRNPPEAEAVVQIVGGLKADATGGGLTIGVVTPFRAQSELIADRLEAAGLMRGVTVGTAHRYQGDERDVMIFSPVVARGIRDSTARWVENPPNLINVAVTRAREALFVVADFASCRQQRGILRDLVNYADTVKMLRETSAEELLLFSWMVVQDWSPEVHPVIGDIEVDFVLRVPGKRLAIEVDGSQHEAQQAADSARDAFLQSHGYTVMRVPARAVRETPANVIHQIGVQLGSDALEADPLNGDGASSSEATP